jgi:hypothetical protein
MYRDFFSQSDNNDRLLNPGFDQGLNEDFTFHFFDLILSLDCFGPGIIHFEIFEAERPFRSSVLTHSIEVFRHSPIKVITLANVE